MSSDLALCDHSMVRPLIHVFEKKAVIMQRRMYARTSRDPTRIRCSCTAVRRASRDAPARARLAYVDERAVALYTVLCATHARMRRRGSLRGGLTHRLIRLPSHSFRLSGAVLLLLGPQAILLTRLGRRQRDGRPPPRRLVVLFAALLASHGGDVRGCGGGGCRRRRR